MMEVRTANERVNKELRAYLTDAANFFLVHLCTTKNAGKIGDRCSPALDDFFFHDGQIGDVYFGGRLLELHGMLIMSFFQEQKLQKKYY
jgi:hypothetical protein